MARHSGPAPASPWDALGDVGDVSGCVVFLASNLASYLTGTTLHADGGTFASSGWFNWPGTGWSNTVPARRAVVPRRHDQARLNRRRVARLRRGGGFQDRGVLDRDRRPAAAERGPRTTRYRSTPLAIATPTHIDRRQPSTRASRAAASTDGADGPRSFVAPIAEPMPSSTRCASSGRGSRSRCDTLGPVPGADAASRAGRRRWRCRARARCR